ncbi:hypothetical protein [Streptomyces violaceusniger]|uniref:Uncharacterized protein n=1 Tax=Streptomyces violaceusniger (strain Tu 4113) TaxID=653045 RepID=G2PGT7_STRV4|nr:hypothetical protein [Streptomyces violaceusniger]AEM88651.1 hypothetical protein Strvi_9394 [Streptomyces violaceusniger Tu 4113]
MSAPSPTTTPIPRDPRTPLERAQDRLAAARRKLIGPSLSRAERREIADRIHDLTVEIKSLSG